MESYLLSRFLMDILPVHLAQYDTTLIFSFLITIWIKYHLYYTVTGKDSAVHFSLLCDPSPSARMRRVCRRPCRRIADAGSTYRPSDDRASPVAVCHARDIGHAIKSILCLHKRVKAFKKRPRLCPRCSTHL